MGRNARLFLVAGLLVALGIAILVSPFASSAPDGLEKVSRDKGFDQTAGDHHLAESPVAGYGVSGVGNDKVGTGLAGLVGTLVTFGLGLGVFALLRGRGEPRSPGAEAVGVPPRSPS